MPAAAAAVVVALLAASSAAAPAGGLAPHLGRRAADIGGGVAVMAAPSVVLPYPTADKLAPAVAGWASRFAPAGLPPATADDDVKHCLNPMHFAQTFDDGPSDPTPALLDELKKRNVKVTFFVVGSRVLERPDVLRRAFAEGHQIALHTWSHPHLPSVPSEQLVAEMLFTARIVKETIGVTPKFMRPPYGETDARVRSVMKRLGLVSVIWSFDSEDSAGSTTVVRDMTAFAARTPKDGPVTLEHDLFATQARQGPGATDGILAAGYKIVRLDECTGMQAYDDSLWNGFSATDGLAPVGVVPSEPAASSTTAASSSSSIAATSTSAAAAASTSPAPSSAAATTSAPAASPTQLTGVVHAPANGAASSPKTGQPAAHLGGALWAAALAVAAATLL
ncbi:chitin deacetylase [Polyrhizophydium stewartii]|uniref:Chitin deacetylase n=1 Tax=Polyrhizophydium stewartii TaxID=2732419 RepID=A0ABR4N5U6_9FUNG